MCCNGFRLTVFGQVRKILQKRRVRLFRKRGECVAGKCNCKEEWRIQQFCLWSHVMSGWSPCIFAVHGCVVLGRGCFFCRFRPFRTRHGFRGSRERGPSKLLTKKLMVMCHVLRFGKQKKLCITLLV
jgi:hypothetical protein